MRAWEPTTLTTNWSMTSDDNGFSAAPNENSDNTAAPASGDQPGPGRRGTFSLRQKESRWLIALVCTGIALRIMIVVFRAGELNSDPDAYVAHAETLRQTGGYNVPDTNTPTAFRPPLYPAMLATLRLTGMKVRVAIGLINVLAGAVVIIATWWMARVIGLRGRWPIVAAAAVAVDPLLLRYTVLPMTEVLAAALMSFAVLQVLKARLFLTSPAHNHGLATGESNSPSQSAIMAGICFGLGGLCRPVVLVTCAALTFVQVAMFCWQALRRNQPDTQRQLSAAAGRVIILPALVAGLVILPWVIRNAVQFNAFIPATSHGGYTLLLGNNDVFYDDVVLGPDHPAWAGPSLNQWQQNLRQQLEADRAAGVDGLDTEVGVDGWMYDRALNTIDQRRGDFMSACVLRWKRFWALVPSVNSESATFAKLTLPVGLWYAALWTGLAGSLLFCLQHCVMQAIVGRADLNAKPPIEPTPDSKADQPLQPLLLRSVTDVQLLWVAVGSLLVLHSFYWTNARMRAPVMGLLCVLAVTGWQYWYSVFQHRLRTSR